MDAEPGTKNSLEQLGLLDPAKVVLHRSWSAPVEPDGTIDLNPSQQTSGHPWAFPQTATTNRGWLQGLIKEEAAAASWGGNWKEAERDRAAGWLDGLVQPEPAPSVSNSSASWLAGLIKSEARPAMADLRRMLLGDSSEESSSSAARPARDTEQTGNHTEHPNDPFAAPAGPFAAPTGPSVAQKNFSRGASPATPSGDVETAYQRPRPGGRPVPTPAAEPLPPGASFAQPALHASSVRTPGVVPPSVGSHVEPLQPAKKELLLKPRQAQKKLPTEKGKTAPRRAERPVGGYEKASFYHAFSVMFDAGVPLFAIFEFLAREGTAPRVSGICRRLAQNLASGQSLPAAAAAEPELFDSKAVRMLEAGYRSGNLSGVLQRLAKDEEDSWRLYQNLRSQLTYPCIICLLTLAAVFILPPLVLTELLEQVIALTAQPPVLTQWLLRASALVASPQTIAILVFALGGLIWWLRSARGREVMRNAEVVLWFVPAIGPMWRSIVSLRFMRIFSMTYEAGIPATLGLELACSACDSELVRRVYPVMKTTLIDGGSLTESLAAGGFLPSLALESVNAGESSGSIARLMSRGADILAAEVESRTEQAVKLIEPLVLATLGVVVGLFVVGCILPVVELTATL